MSKKLLILMIFLLLTTLLFPILIYADTENPFGQMNATDGGGTSSPSLTQQAIQSGKDAAGQMAEWKNVSELNEAMEGLFKYIRWGISFLTALGTISSFFILSWSFIRLAANDGAEFQRFNCYKDILKSGICCICFGGLTLLMTIFYKTFSNFINNTIMLTNNWELAFAYALVEYKFLICGVCAVLSVTMFVIFLKDIVVLSTSSGNSQKRAKAIKDLFVTGAATIGIGGVGVFVAVFNGMLL
jgi:hypothetical protein